MMNNDFLFILTTEIYSKKKKNCATDQPFFVKQVNWDIYM